MKKTDILITEALKTKQKLSDVEHIKSDLELRLSESEELRFSTSAYWFG